MQDLKKAMPDLGHGLQQLLDYPGDVEADLATSFSIEEDNFGEVQTRDLKPDGSNIPVTNSNRQEYVDLYTHWVMQESVQAQFAAFSEGFHQASCLQLVLYRVLTCLSQVEVSSQPWPSHYSSCALGDFRRRAWTMHSGMSCGLFYLCMCMQTCFSSRRCPAKPGDKAAVTVSSLKPWRVKSQSQVVECSSCIRLMVVAGVWWLSLAPIPLRRAGTSRLWSAAPGLLWPQVSSPI